MSRAAEFIAFAGLALCLHLGIWLGIARPGSEAAGSGGEAVLSLMAATGDVADLVAAWTRPTAVMQELAPPPVAPDTDRSEMSLTEPAPAPAPATPTLAPPPLPPTLPETSDALPQVDASSFDPSVLQAAPRTSLRPLARGTRPATPDRVAPAAPQPAPAPPSQAAGAQAQTAAGAQSGENAGNQSPQRPATLSDAARSSLMAKWGASIRNRIERRKDYPRGTTASGTTVLRITVSRTGRLIAVSVVTSSGTSQLDQAALRAVQRARYPAAPKGLDDPEYRFNLPLAFTKN